MKEHIHPTRSEVQTAPHTLPSPLAGRALSSSPTIAPEETVQRTPDTETDDALTETEPVLGHDFSAIRVFPPAGMEAGPPPDPVPNLPNIQARALSPQVARDPLPTAEPGTTDAGPVAGAAPVPADAQAALVQAFIDHGMYGPQALVPPTNTGGFDASYDPSGKLLTIEVRGGVEFLNGLTLGPDGTIVPNHTDLAQAATDGMALPVPDRTAFVADFQWQDAQKATFNTSLQSRVESAWSGQHSFACTRPGWDAVTAGVTIRVNVHTGPNVPTDHLHITPYKVPDSGTYNVGAFVQSHGDQDAHNNDMVMSSTHVAPTPLSASLLRKSVFFDNDSAELSADAQATLTSFSADFRTNNIPMSNPVDLVGHASSTGTAAHNQVLAQQRIDAVQNFLLAQGFNGLSERVSSEDQGATGATADPSFRRVDLIVGSGEGQAVVSHEFGHEFGLMDEYSGGNDAAGNPVNPGGSISGSGLPVGTVTGHDAMAKAIGAPGSIAENNDNIMSLGNTVRPQHYATFGWALGQVTGVTEWQVS